MFSTGERHVQRPRDAKSRHKVFNVVKFDKGLSSRRKSDSNAFKR